MSGNPSQIQSSSSLTAKHHLIFACTLIVIEGFLIFSRLGHYPLWGDEAITALYGQSIWRTGDANAVLGHNLIAINKGFELKNLKARYTPPLSYYLTALTIGALGPTAYAARLPNALGGWLTMVLIAYWLYRSKPDWVTWLVAIMGFSGNVSLALFVRQSRYYGLAMMFSLLVVYWYLKATPHNNNVTAISISAALLSATNYLQYGALAACLTVDYSLWRRKTLQLPKRVIVRFLLGQAVIAAVLLVVYNPVGRDTINRQGSVFLNKLGIFFATLRDFNYAEFGVGVLLLLAPLLYILTHDGRLLRGTVAILIYIAAATVISPRWMPFSAVADIRYVSPLIPLGVGMSVLVVLHFGRLVSSKASIHRAVLIIPLAIIAFGTNLLHAVPLAYPDGFRSSILAYVKELAGSYPSSFSVTIEWLEANVEEGDSIWVIPYHSAHPLMYHFPQAVYAWQLTWPPQSQFFGLDQIHFLGRTCPDYIIAFGPFRNIVDSHHALWRSYNVEFTLIETIQHYWEDKTRPELTIHAFQPITAYDLETEAIYIYRRIKPNEPCRCGVTKDYEDKVKYWQ